MRLRPLFLFPFALAAACGAPLGLPRASFENKVDTVSLYALSGTPVSFPSAYSLLFNLPVRPDQTTSLDFAFDLDSAGRAKLFPTGALHLGRASGIQLTTTPFDSIVIAPTGRYQLDSAVVVDSNSVAILSSTSSPSIRRPDRTGAGSTSRFSPTSTAAIAGSRQACRSVKP